MGNQSPELTFIYFTTINSSFQDHMSKLNNIMKMSKYKYSNDSAYARVYQRQLQCKRTIYDGEKMQRRKEIEDQKKKDDVMSEDKRYNT